MDDKELDMVYAKVIKNINDRRFVVLRINSEEYLDRVVNSYHCYITVIIKKEV